MKKYLFSFMGCFIAVIYFLLSNIYEFDLFERILKFFAFYEKYEIDELIVSVGIVICFIAVDMGYKIYNINIQKERFCIYEVMLKASHHVLNNFLNKVQMLRIYGEERNAFTHEELELFDNCFEDAVQCVQRLSDVTNITPNAIWDCVAPVKDGFKSYCQKHT